MLSALVMSGDMRWSVFTVLRVGVRSPDDRRPPQTSWLSAKMVRVSSRGALMYSKMGPHRVWTKHVQFYIHPSQGGQMDIGLICKRSVPDKA